MPITVLTELHYLPSVAFFQPLLGADRLLLDAHENYRKQTLRNRAFILTAQGPQALTVPVLDGASATKQATSAILIDYGQPWVPRHLRTLQTAYGASPYFSFYADYLADIYAQKPARLWDLNLALLQFILRALRWPLPIEFTSGYVEPAAAQPLVDRRNWLTGRGGPDFPSQRAYPQLFGPGFVPGLSVLDLLFMQGPAAGRFL